MDKKVLYALIGGVAVVGAAVAYHLASKASEEADNIDEDLEQLGPPEYEKNGHLKFDYFLKIFQICSFYGKTNFASKKREFIR
jgi:hypothetical protein